MLSIIIKKDVFDSLSNGDKHYLKNCHNVKVFLCFEEKIFIHCSYDGESFNAKTTFLSEKGIPYSTEFLSEHDASLVKLQGKYVQIGFLSN